MQEAFVHPTLTLVPVRRLEQGRLPQSDVRQNHIPRDSALVYQHMA